MKQPIHWKPAVEAEPVPGTEPTRRQARAMTAISLLVVVGTTVIVLAVPSPARWVFEVLFFLPQALCGAWLGHLFLGPDSRWSTAKVGFSFGRLFIGSLIGLGLLLVLIFWLAHSSSTN